MVHVTMVGMVVVRQEDGGRGGGGRSNGGRKQSGCMYVAECGVEWSAQWIMDREVVFGAIQSIVLINGDNGVYCCSCFWGSGCGCCRNCFV